MHGLNRADYVLSGLPFSTLPPGVGPAIAAAGTHSVLRSGGAFLVYQFSPKVKDFLTPFFERIERGFEWINVPARDPVLGLSRARSGPTLASADSPKIEAAG